MRREGAQGAAEFRHRPRRVAAIQRYLSSGPVHAALFAIGRHDGRASFEPRQRLVGFGVASGHGLRDREKLKGLELLVTVRCVGEALFQLCRRCRRVAET